MSFLRAIVDPATEDNENSTKEFNLTDQIDRGVSQNDLPSQNPPQMLQNGEFESLGKASSRLIAKLSNRAKVTGAAQSPNGLSPSTRSSRDDASNVIYLNDTHYRPRNRVSADTDPTKTNQKPAELFFIFR